LWQWLTSIGEQVGKIFSEVWNKCVNFVLNIKNKIVEFLSSLGDWSYEKIITPLLGIA
jgi:hypothetical protein